MSDARKAAAEERAAFYEAAGIKPGQIITATTRVQFEGRATRAGWQQYARKLAAPGDDLARLVDAKADVSMRSEQRNGQDRYHFNGIASVTDKPYRMYDWLGEYDETVKREAFTDTLAASPDVAFLTNHKGLTLARTKNGTLELAMGATGLQSDAWCNPDRNDVNDLFRSIDDGDVDEMSFAFMLEEGWWSDDFEQFMITKLSIDRGDVSAVNYGSNPYTSIGARTPQIMNEISMIAPAAAREAIRILTSRADVAAIERRIEAEAVVEADTQTRAAATLTDTPAGRSLNAVEAMLTLSE